MKKLVSIGLVASLTILAGIFFDSTVGAQSAPTTQSQTVRCDVAQGRLTTRITQVDKTVEAHKAIYADLQSKIVATLATAEATDFDTADLSAARDAVVTAVEVYGTKSTDYSSLLMATKNLSCGESDSAFATSLGTTRKALTETRESNVAVATAFKEKAIPALEAYATWLKTNMATEAEDK